MTEFIRVETHETELGLDALEVALSAASMEEFLKGPVVEEMHERAKRRFASSGDDASGPWAPLEQTWTVRERLEAGDPPGPALMRSGALYDFLIGTPGHVENEGDDARLLFPGEGGDQEVKLATHQRGMANPLPGHRPIPKREVAALSAKDAGTVTELFHSWIEERMRVGA